MTVSPLDAVTEQECGAERELVIWFTNEIGRAVRTCEHHQPNDHGKCRGCSTQLHLIVWPCRMFRLAAAACELVATRFPDSPQTLALRPTQDVADAAFRHAIHANAIEETVPMRAVPRTPPSAPGTSGRSIECTGKK
jgi:hypothetical protein